MSPGREPPLEPVTKPDEAQVTGQSLPQESGYVIVSEIGRGGMGIVYRAHDIKLGRLVALKRPRPEVMALPDFSRRFLREARTASRLLHPNITTVFAAYEENGVPWLVMELVEGVSLRTRLASGEPLPVNEIVEHGEGLADALRAAHEQGILHSDVNPNNILIGRDGRARLTDFGLARARNAPGALPVFDAAEVPTWSVPEAAGTRGYMAPEHLRGAALDPRSDIYCLGLVLYEMCVGTPVFAGKSTVEWVGAAMDGETERLARLGPGVPPELARVVAKATATRPQRRYQTATEMAADLRALRRYRESGVEIAVAAAARARKRTSYGLLAAVMVVAAAGAVALLSWRSGGPPVLRSRPLTSAPEWEAQPALSPDGRLIAYASNQTGNADIWIADVATGEARRLTDDPGDDIDPAWFPDGAAVAYVSRRNAEESVLRRTLLGGRPELLVPGAGAPAVSPDGTMLAVTVPCASGYNRIAVAPVDRSAPPRVITGDGDGMWSHAHPAWAPDGRRICYADARHLWVVSTDGGAASRLTSGPAGDRDPVWAADGRTIYFSSVREGPQSLWRIAASGGEPQRLTQGTGPEVQPSLSRDGRRLAYATRRFELEIEARHLGTGATWRIGSSAYDAMPAVQPDGRGVAFVSNRLGSYDLWHQALGPAGPEGPSRRLTALEGTLAMPAFSPDGRWLAFHRTVDGERDIWIIPATGGAPTNLTSHPGFDLKPAFSPGGTAVAFVSARGGGEHLWVCGFSGGRLVGEPRQLTFGGAADYSPAWSPDGRLLAFARTESDGTDVWVVAPGAEAPPRRLTHGAKIDHVRWAADATALLASARWDGKTMEVRRVRVADGRNEAYVPPLVLGEEGAEGEFDVARDGTLVAIDSTTVTGDVWLAEGLPGTW